MERVAAVLLGLVGVAILTLAAVTQLSSSGALVGPGVDIVFKDKAGDLVSPPLKRAVNPPRPLAGLDGGAAGTVAGPTAKPGVSAAPISLPDLVGARLSEILGSIAQGGIRFEVGSAELDQRARLTLDKLALVLLSKPDLQVEIRGHTDATGSPELNVELSLARAKSVVGYLNSRGVSVSQVRALGYADGQPVADNETPDGRAANRRSDVSLIGGSNGSRG